MFEWDTLLLGSRLTLAGVYGVAGIAKLTDRQGTRQAFLGFGLPDGLAKPMAVALPLSETLVSLMLLPLATARSGAFLALILMCAFQIAIARSLIQGKFPDCHCFGQLHSKPLSWTLFARNLVFLAMATLSLAFGPGASAFAWLSNLTPGESANLLLTFAVLGMLLPVYLAIRKISAQQARLLETTEDLKRMLQEEAAEIAPASYLPAVAPGQGLPVGVYAPDFSLPSLRGANVSLGDLVARGKWTLLLFVSPNCAPCRDLLPQVQLWEKDYGQSLTVVLVSKGSAEQIRKKLAVYSTEFVLLHGESGMAEAYQATWTPAAVLINPEGKIASPVRAGNEAIRALLSHTVRLATDRASGGPQVFLPEVAVGNSRLKVGELAPSFSLSDLQGNPVDSGQLLGRASLLLFWASSCLHCLGMQAQFDSWKTDAPTGAPRLVLVASGDLALIKEHLEGNDFLTLLDSDRQVSKQYGVTGAPSGILLDSQGRIASSIASGAQQILALAGVPYRESQVVRQV